MFLTNSSHVVFLKTSLFTTLLSLLKSAGVVFNSSISNLLVSVFKLAKSIFLAKSVVSTPVYFLKKSAFVA